LNRGETLVPPQSEGRRICEETDRQTDRQTNRQTDREGDEIVAAIEREMRLVITLRRGESN
jgi:hypothetical protein